MRDAGRNEDDVTLGDFDDVISNTDSRRPPSTYCSCSTVFV